MPLRRLVLVVGAVVLVPVLVVLVWWWARGDDLPDSQGRFLDAVSSIQERARDATDVQLVQAREDRATRLCAGQRSAGIARPELSVQGWAGTAQDIGTEGDDVGTLRLELDHDVTLVVDGSGGGGVTPGSQLFRALSKVDDGDEVTFSGRFVRDPDTCVAERSLRLVNSLRTPDFDFVLTSISPRG